MSIYVRLEEELKKILVGLNNGLYVWGNPGLGKSHTIQEILENNSSAGKFKIIKGDITPKGLFNTVCEHEDSILILDDNLDIKDRKIRKLLMPMLEKPKDKSSNAREISWITHREEKVVNFTGGIIIISNFPLPKDHHGQAIRSRVDVIHFELTKEQLAEKIQFIVKDGYMGLRYDQIKPYINFYYKCFRKSDKQFDLRQLLDKVMPHIVAYRRKIVKTNPVDFIKRMFDD